MEKIFFVKSLPTYDPFRWHRDRVPTCCMEKVEKMLPCWSDLKHCVLVIWGNRKSSKEYKVPPTENDIHLYVSNLNLIRNWPPNHKQMDCGPRKNFWVDFTKNDPILRKKVLFLIVTFFEHSWIPHEWCLEQGLVPTIAKCHIVKMRHLYVSNLNLIWNWPPNNTQMDIGLRNPV